MRAARPLPSARREADAGASKAAPPPMRRDADGRGHPPRSTGCAHVLGGNRFPRLAGLRRGGICLRRAWIPVPAALSLLLVALLPLASAVDGDGFEEPADCDDRDFQACPGAQERPDGRDNDCDGQIDEDGRGDACDDSDKDGLLDGGEVFVTSGDPRDPATDGELHGDGAEVAAGSSPEDPLSVPTPAGPLPTPERPLGRDLGPTDGLAPVR